MGSILGFISWGRERKRVEAWEVTGLALVAQRRPSQTGRSKGHGVVRTNKRATRGLGGTLGVRLVVADFYEWIHLSSLYSALKPTAVNVADPSENCRKAPKRRTDSWDVTWRRRKTAARCEAL